MDDRRPEELGAEWREAFDALKAAGLEHDADHPIAARYRAASDAVNHENRARDFGIAEYQEGLEAKIASLQGIIGYTALHINERYVVTQLTTEQKELWADAVEAYEQRLFADDPKTLADLTPYDRWWRNP